MAPGFCSSHDKGRHQRINPLKHTGTLGHMLEMGQCHEKTLESIHIHWMPVFPTGHGGVSSNASEPSSE
jgi:hypothetical protein